MARTPLISVCVPAHNYARFLGDCIESVRSQTLTDWELIVCDDCSTDNTAELVEEHAKTDERIRYVRNERRLGMNANIKKVAELGRGKYLKMLCADDWLTPGCLETFYRLMEDNPDVTLATSAEFLSNEAGQPLQIQFLFGRPLSILAGDEMLGRMSRGEGFGGHSSFFIRTASYRNIGGYDDTLFYAADYDLGARLCLVGDYLHTDEPLFCGRLHGESSSSLNPGKLLDLIDWFEIPKRLFAPRHFCDRQWRRYQRLTGSLTARYLVNAGVQYLRGDREYARGVAKELVRRGNFLFGVPLIVTHIPVRIFKRVTGNHRPTSIPLGASTQETAAPGAD